MRVCKCGGVVSQSELTSGRERWSCNSCGRYEILEKAAESEDETEDMFSDMQEVEPMPL